MPSKDTIFVCREVEENYNSVQDFYGSLGYFQPIQPNDIVVTASTPMEICGAVRLAFEMNIVVLRGMYVVPHLQRRGIGTLMLKEIEKYIGIQDCFCLPHGWLEDFYSQIRFFKIPDIDAPAHLYNRLIENRKKYPQLIAMKRPH